MNMKNQPTTADVLLVSVVSALDNARTQLMAHGNAETNIEVALRYVDKSLSEVRGYLEERNHAQALLAAHGPYGQD